MKIVIAGGTGFVGQHLVDYFTSKDDQVIILTRNPRNNSSEDNVTYVEWLNGDSQPELQVNSADVFINLAGESLNGGRWNDERKKRILESRITTTRELIRIMNAMTNPPHTFINASAIGFYGISDTEIFTEQTVNPGSDFLAEVCNIWEQEANEANKLDIRTVKARFGLILDQHNGALPKIALPYKLFAGGRLGSGEQWVSWVHIYDVVKIIDWIINNKQVSGSVNITAPDPKRNKDFGKELSNTIKRPHWLPAPSFAIKTLLGEMSLLLLCGQYVYPKALEDSGYPFQFATLQTALRDLYER
ncbi:TIGR01777 family oxidoreductase [Alkalibacillus haloalkaliphilus]|uniref:TIGR01777 family oxidoreductase n=1 Tax=Alkalibacillus haloalkaliphilus TaxID=94136 RepID=UPI00030FDB4C|nr:TIGR01777 family oxidoreductase [Alkalibacillus haloalkaliphilus]